MRGDDRDPFPIESGGTRVVRFPDYQRIVGLRTNNSEGVVVFADEFVMPR